MAYSRRLGVVGILSACWLVAAVGCSDDEDRPTNGGEAGEGGDDSGGKGGTPSGGGNSNNGGKAGTAGNGGSAGSSSSGDAGSGTAGDAGSGSGGDAGSGGIVAGAGGEGGSGETGGGGEGGQAIGGAGGEGGEPAAPVAKSCVAVCENDDDCVDDSDLQKTCNDVTKICESCSADADCYPEISGWLAPCESTEECGDAALVCVTYQGNNYCALVEEPAGTCASYEQGVVSATLVEGGAVDVCADTNARCFEGKCGFSCAVDECDEDEGDTCNPVSGRCECQNSTECGENLVCVNNLCTECAVDDDCAPNEALTGLGKCVAGKCSCADVEACPASAYPDATLACQ